MAASASEAVSPSEWYQYRVEKLAKRQAEKGIQTYPHKFQTTISIADYIARFEKLEAGNRDDSEDFSVAGRIVGHRASGAKLNFYEIRGEGAKMQVFFDAKSFQGDYVEVAGTIHRGDIVGITGFPMRTKRGELSIVPRQLVLLSPCLKPLPGAQNELTEQETRYRNRHLDLIANHDRVRKIFETRTGIIKHIRRYLDDRRFLEVETPMMTAVAGGAAARPFITHHNDLNIDVFLRISPELYLKQLVVGGLERVYEIGRQMRNEGLDLTHNPEFTSCEFYMAYADYHDLITMTEELLSSMALSLKGTTKVMVVPFSGDKSKDPVEIDFAPPYRRVSMIAELERICGVAFPRPLDGPECNAFLRELCASRGVECSPPTTTARLIDKLVGEYIEPTCINPTFICDHPQLMSPLAKWHRDNSELTERFELFINGKEICNAYTELNNPHVQRQCFADQLKDKEAGDIEAQMIDETFCDALDHGLPPTGGWGIGIDRLTMMLTGQNNIKEVVLFPAMRPLPSASSPEKEPEAAAPVPATETVSPSS